MQWFSRFIIPIGFFIILVTVFIPVKHMYIVESIVFILFIIMYLFNDNKAISFLSRYKYVVLINILVYFFILRNRDGGYWGVDEENIFFSDSIILFMSFFFGYVLIRIDRLQYLKNLNLLK